MLTWLLKLLASLLAFICNLGALFFLIRFILKLLPEMGQSKLFEKTDEYANYLLDPIRQFLPQNQEETDLSSEENSEEKSQAQNSSFSPDWSELAAAGVVWILGRILKVLI